MKFWPFLILLVLTCARCVPPAGDDGGSTDATRPDAAIADRQVPTDNGNAADRASSGDRQASADGAATDGANSDDTGSGDAAVGDHAAPDATRDAGIEDAALSDHTALDAPSMDTQGGTGGNRPPLPQNDAYPVKNDAILVTDDLRANDRDPDGDALQITYFSSPSHGHLAYLAGGRFRYDPDDSYSGDDLFTYTVDDGHGAQASATVSLQVLDNSGGNANTPPRARDDRATAITSIGRVIAVLANDMDPDGDTLILSVSQTASHGAVLNNWSDLTYISEPDFTGSDRFSYLITDGRGGQAVAWVDVEVIAAPLAATPGQVTRMHLLAEPEDLVLTSTIATQSLITLSFVKADGSPLSNQRVDITDLPRLQTPAYLGYFNGAFHRYVTDSAGQVQGLAQATFDDVSDFYDGPVYTYTPEAYFGCNGCSAASPDGSSSTLRVASTGTFRAATLSDDPPWVYMGRGADVWTPLRIDLFDALGHPMPEGALVIVFDQFLGAEYGGEDPSHPVPHIFVTGDARIDQGTALYSWSYTPALVVRLDAQGGFDARYHSPQIDLLTGSSAAAAQNDLNRAISQGANVHSFNPDGSLDSFWGRTFADGPSSTLPHGTGPLAVDISYTTPNGDDTYFYSPGEMPSVEVNATVFDGRGRPIPEGAEVDFGAPANWLQVCGAGVIYEAYTDGIPPDLLGVSLRVGPGGSVQLFFRTDALAARQGWLGQRVTRSLEFFVGGRIIDDKLNVNAGPVTFDVIAPAAGAVGWPARSTLWPYMSENKIRFTNLTDGAGHPLPKGTPLTVSATYGWVTRPGSFDGNDNEVLVDDNGSVRATFHAHTDRCTPGSSRRAKVRLYSTAGDVLGETAFDLICPVVNFFDMTVGLRVRDIPIINIPFIIGDLQRVADRGRAHKKRALQLAMSRDSNSYDIMQAQRAYLSTFRQDIGQGVADLIKAVPNTSFTGPSNAEDLINQVKDGVLAQAQPHSLGLESQANTKQWVTRYLQMARRRQDAEGHACGHVASGALPATAPDVQFASSGGLIDGSQGDRVGLYAAEISIVDNGVLVSGSAMHVGDRDVAFGTVLAPSDMQAMGFASGSTEVAVLEVSSVDAASRSATLSVLIISAPDQSRLPDSPGTATVGVAGGQVGDGQGFVLDIPASALGADTDLVMRGVLPFASDQVSGVQNAIVVRSTRLDAIDSGDNVTGLTLTPAGSLSAGYAVDPGDATRSDEGVQLSSLVLCRWDAGQGLWTPLSDSVVDSAASVVSASINGAGLFALAGLP